MLPAMRFFDDPRYLRTVVAEHAAGESGTRAREALQRASCPPNALILDAGCGNGRHAIPLAEAGCRVVGLDRSPVLIGAARRAACARDRPRFLIGSYTALPFGPRTFDAVLWLGTALGYEGEAGDRQALREFRRVLGPAGRLVIETLHRDEIGVRLGSHEERELPGGGTLCFDRRFDRRRSTLYEVQRLDGGPPRDYELRVYGREELGRMVEEAGFEVVAAEASPVSPLVLVAQVR
jgi:SAM-dependent methyltransferase